MTSAIVYGGLLIGILIALGMVFRAKNSAKVEASKADESKQTTNQKTAHDETREDVTKARLATRRERRWWRWGHADEPLPPMPALDPKPNRPTQS